MTPPPGAPDDRGRPPRHWPLRRRGGRCHRCPLWPRLVIAACAGTAALGLAAPAGADPVQRISLYEEYEVTPAVSAQHRVFLTAEGVALSQKQCQEMGNGTNADVSRTARHDGQEGCEFHWSLADAGAEVFTIDDTGKFAFRSRTDELLAGFDTPDARATVASVVLTVHGAHVHETSGQPQIDSHDESTKNDATTVTWSQPDGAVEARGTIDPGASPTPPPPPATGATPPPATAAPSGLTRPQAAGHADAPDSSSGIYPVLAGFLTPLAVVAVFLIVGRWRANRAGAASEGTATAEALPPPADPAESAESARFPYGKPLG